MQATSGSSKIFKPSSSEALKVLLVEDDEFTLRLLHRVLQSCGYEVEVARNGRQALDVLLQEDVVDVVLTDVLMPEVNGIELIAQLRSRLGARDIPVVVMSSQQRKDLVLAAFAAGASDFLIKPLQHTELRSLSRHCQLARSLLPQQRPSPASSASSDGVTPVSKDGATDADMIRLASGCSNSSDSTADGLNLHQTATAACKEVQGSAICRPQTKGDQGGHNIVEWNESERLRRELQLLIMTGRVTHATKLLTRPWEDSLGAKPLEIAPLDIVCKGMASTCVPLFTQLPSSHPPPAAAQKTVAYGAAASILAAKFAQALSTNQALASNGGASRCAANRRLAIQKFRAKRAARSFEKKVRYTSRQKLAEVRPRVRGQFVKAGTAGATC